MKYSMVIQWSDEDQAYVVSFPEFGDLAHTHGATYVQAAQAGIEVLELLVETCQEEGAASPAPSLFTPEPLV